MSTEPDEFTVSLGLLVEGAQKGEVGWRSPRSRGSELASLGKPSLGTNWDRRAPSNYEPLTATTEAFVCLATAGLPLRRSAGPAST